jgi:hypothetical protein
MQILSERDRRTEQKWIQMVNRIQRIGIDNAGILDPATGKVTGRAGTFLIDERLLPKLRFIRDGQLSERDGAPVVRLVGELQPVRTAVDEAFAKVAHVPINEREIIAAFVEERAVPDPVAYIRQLCHVQSMWVPAYYYIGMAGKSVAEALEIIKEEPTSYPGRRKWQSERLAKGDARLRVSAKTNKQAHDRVIARDKFDLAKPADALAFLKAIRTVSSHEIDKRYVMPLLRQCFERYHGIDPKLTSEIRYAAAHLDYELHGPGTAANIIAPVAAAR